MQTVKTCTKCGETKPLDGFHKAKGCRYGVRSTCKPCVAEQKRRYQEENRDEIRERKHRYYEANRDKIAEQNRRYREENRDKIAEHKRRYYEENRDEIAEKGRRHYEENRDEMLERGRRYREENREEIAERGRRYREENREIVSAKNVRQRRERQELSEAFATTPIYTPWTREEEQFLMANNGMTTYEKAVKLGRTYSSCNRKLEHLRKKLGVSPGAH